MKKYGKKNYQKKIADKSKKKIETKYHNKEKIILPHKLRSDNSGKNSPPKLIKPSYPKKGIISRIKNLMMITPLNSKGKKIPLAKQTKNSYSPGDIIYYSTQKNRHNHKTQANIIKKIGNIDFLPNGELPKNYHDLTIHEYELRNEFDHEIIDHCQKLETRACAQHLDYKNIPFITIDPADARDHDDAVFTETLKAVGYRLYVAIADVSHYVRENDVVDAEALLRAYSVYFPNRVIPMLPEKISQELCSLKSNGEKLVILCIVDINKNGKILKYKFQKATIIVRANLSYQEAQSIHDNDMKNIRPQAIACQETITELFNAWECLNKARKNRKPLEITSDEVEIKFDAKQKISDIKPVINLQSHKLIEEFMIAANVCAAQYLQKVNQKFLYRTHSKPDAVKLQELHQTIKAWQIKPIKSHNPQPEDFNNLFKGSDYLQNDTILSQIIIRAQAKAVYGSKNIGHYGLQLENYTHFTSPIRRYADLTVHRAISRIISNDDSSEQDNKNDDTLTELANHLIQSEITAAKAERTTLARFFAHYYIDKINHCFLSHVTGANKAGLFVRLAQSGADAFIPSRFLPQTSVKKYRRHNTENRMQPNQFMQIFPLGSEFRVKITRSDPIAANIVCKPV